MTDEWQTKALAAVCQIKPPKSEARERVSADGLVSFLPMEDMRTDEKFVRALQAKPLSAVAGSYTYFANGDVLLAKITPCFENGKLGIVEGLDNGVGFGSSEYVVFRPDRTLSNEWLYYYLSRETFRVEGAARMTGAVGHKRVPKEFIESYPIPVPSLSEQQRIVGILDEAFDGIATATAHAQTNLRNARALLQNYLQSVFTQSTAGWTRKPLETVAAILNGYAFKSTDFSTKAGVKCIKITNVGVREFVSESNSYLPARFTRQYGAVSVKKGSIVLALTRTIISGGLKVAVVPDEYDGSLLNQRVASILADTNHLSGSFLFAYLSTQTIVDYVKERVNTLMQPNLSITDLRSMPVPVPPRPIQDEITKQLAGLREETRRLESIYQHKLAALEALKKSLLHQAFSGEL